MDKPLALITGASRGIGRAVAIQLARDGYGVVVNYLTNREAAETVRELILREGGAAVVRGFDVANQPAVQDAVREITQTVGPIQILINNAWTGRAQLLMKMPDEDWHTVIDTDLNGVYFCAKAVVRTWAGKRPSQGRIINMTSLAGEVGYAGSTHYCAAKAGVIGFTKALALELAPLGITVNAIAPGFIETDATQHLALGEWLKRIPLGRTGLPEEVAHLVSFLVSDRASYITGQVLRVNGGAWM